MIWKIKPQFPASQTAALEKLLSTNTSAFPAPLAIVLMQRGILTLEEARRFLAPQKEELNDPFLMLDMQKACARILMALDNKENILIYGDYDVDGTTSVSVLQLFLEDLGFQFEVYIPNRFTEGYGISFEGIQYAADSGCKLVIALDCGTKAIDKVNFANEKGIDVIVVDHHLPGEILPEVVAMLNPLQLGCAYPDKTLSAAALTMKLCQGICKTLQEGKHEIILPSDYDPFERYCDLVALSIACDIVPIKGENRTMLHFGLEKIRNNPSAGIRALKELNDAGKEWSVSDLVFYMGPRINSAGRLSNATEAVALLTGKADDLNFLAKSLDAFNEERKGLDKLITAEALTLIAEEEESQRRASTVLFQEDWNKGVIGIVASRLIERHHRPTILLTKSGGYLVGSGRSVPGFDLHAAIEACSDSLVQFGGHKYAAGLTLREEDYEEFRMKFEDFVAANISPASKEAELQIDTILDFEAIDDRFMRLLRRLSPFGPSNPEPNFLAEGVLVKEVKILKNEHVKFLLEHKGVTFEGISFFTAGKWEAINRLLIDIVFQPDTKSWNGNSYTQLKVKDFRASN